jgi:hypothetical protein
MRCDESGLGCIVAFRQIFEGALEFRGFVVLGGIDMLTCILWSRCSGARVGEYVTLLTAFESYFYLFFPSPNGHYLPFVTPILGSLTPTFVINCKDFCHMYTLEIIRADCPASSL